MRGRGKRRKINKGERERQKREVNSSKVEKEGLVRGWKRNMRNRKGGKIVKERRDRGTMGNRRQRKKR